eukprot:GHVH01016161.1.p4 GENE.GHVH01016161.1~~GHVH01016161.1.p4  ORF type:complete len:124 (+),score=10.67 GHVH01016161.1:202-573(+)
MGLHLLAIQGAAAWAPVTGPVSQYQKEEGWDAQSEEPNEAYCYLPSRCLGNRAGTWPKCDDSWSSAYGAGEPHMRFASHTPAAYAVRVATSCCVASPPTADSTAMGGRLFILPPPTADSSSVI